MKLLESKNILITGAGRNIGRCTAIEAAKHGCNVFFTDIDKKSLNKLEKQLSQYPIQAQGFLSDITKTKDIDKLCKQLFDIQPHIQILCNNVGVQGRVNGLLKTNMKEWYDIFKTNLMGPMYLTRQLVEQMVSFETSGSIIFLTSIHQWYIRRLASYSSSKAALGMVIKELAVELAPYRIRVNGIAPGYVAVGENGQPAPHSSTPLYQTSIDPVYIARAVVYLASDYFSKFTTGSVVKIDGGLSLYNHFLI